ncbi:DNA repair protein RAD51 homolog 3-like isoform X2 [Maniola jurtina]|uniref:DNA repair protein RAD51 homolog 3-like isoform X2 n=1 Tax=Maniola jurtina TaxID=191418 RepID=UPI001E686AD6|nr:DNA repair protein RAD51 homolog 3-like isoform X2 [Maniola jurtina]
MSFKMYNATELWQVETSLPSISTFSQSLDKVIGNDGLQLGSLTELLGLPGTGKTQLCLQLCCAIQIPKVLGGLCSEALYIDTNTNFTICRFREILFASLAKCQRLLETSISINEEEALKKLHYVNAFGLEKFCAFLYQLPNFMKSRPNVVITNEMTTRIGLSSGAIVGALGDAWAHRCNKRLLLSAPDPLDNIRLAVLLKSNNSPETIGKFQITHEGIRDID